MTSRAAATRYARAIFDVTLKEGDLRQVERDLGGFDDLVSGHEGLRRVLGNPGVPAPRKRALVQDLVSRDGSLSPIVSKLLLMLAERDRFLLLPEITEAYRQRLMDHAQIVRAEVTTAVAMPADRLNALKDGLSKATGRQVQLENRVDPTIIGGAVARIGSTVFDGSITRQLERMHESLVETAL
jgi:F-type H+-transporting ATPase subunit delta